MGLPVDGGRVCTLHLMRHQREQLSLAKTLQIFIIITHFPAGGIKHLEEVDLYVICKGNIGTSTALSSEAISNPNISEISWSSLGDDAPQQGFSFLMISKPGSHHLDASLSSPDVSAPNAVSAPNTCLTLHFLPFLQSPVCWLFEGPVQLIVSAPGSQGLPWGLRR